MTATTTAPTIFDLARQFRRENAGLTASTALHWARATANEVKLPFEEHGDRIVARIERDGFSIHAQYQPDDNADVSWLGSLTDTWAPNAIKNRTAWYDGPDGPMTEQDSRSYGWIVPCNDPDEARRWYSEHGYSKHNAWLISRQQQRADVEKFRAFHYMDGNATYAMWYLTVRVYLDGVELGFDSLWGIDLGEYDEWEQHATNMAVDTIDQALADAKEKLTTLAQSFAAKAVLP